MSIRMPFLTFGFMTLTAIATAQETGLQPASATLFSPEITERYALHFPAVGEQPPLTLTFSVTERAEAAFLAALVAKAKQPLTWDPSAQRFAFATLAFLDNELVFRGNGAHAEKTYAVANGVAIRSGYDLMAEGEGDISQWEFVKRHTFYGPFGVDDSDLVALVFPGGHDKSAFFSSRFELGGRVRLDLGARYEQPAHADDDRLLPRASLVVLLDGKTRLILGYGRYAAFTGIGDVRPGALDAAPSEAFPQLAGFGALDFADGGLDSVFRTAYRDYVTMALERDLTQKTKLRMEGYQEKKNTGLSFELKTRF